MRTSFLPQKLYPFVQSRAAHPAAGSVLFCSFPPSVPDMHFSCILSFLPGPSMIQYGKVMKDFCQQMKGKMSVAFTYIPYDLSNQSIDAVSEKVQEYLTNLGTERLTLQRIRLTIEEMLFRLQQHAGEDTQIHVAVGKRFGRHEFRMYYKGDAFNPVESTGNEWSDSIMAAVGLKPAWSHSGSLSRCSLALSEKKAPSPAVHIAVAILAALLVGMLGTFIPQSTRDDINRILLTPLGNSFFGVMGTFSGIMIAMTICSGIIGIGDPVTLGKMGRKVILHVFRCLFLITAFTLAAVLPILGVHFTAHSSSGGGQISEVTQMLFDILPSNPVTPFRDGNSLQIIVIAMFLGVGLLAVGERGKHLRILIDEGASLTQHIMAMICRFIPLAVFVMLLRQFWSGDADKLLNAWKPLLLTVVGQFILVAVMVVLAAFRLNCSPRLLLSKILSPGIIALTTASSLAAMTPAMDACEKKLGVDKSLVSFAFPLATVIYKAGSLTAFTVIVCTMAQLYQVEINIAWILMALIILPLISVALPPIPGAGIMAYTILFSKLGIPSDALLMATALELILDYTATGASVMLICTMIAEEGKSQSLLNRSILMDPKSGSD